MDIQKSGFKFSLHNVISYESWTSYFLRLCSLEQTGHKDSIGLIGCLCILNEMVYFKCLGLYLYLVRAQRVVLGIRMCLYPCSGPTLGISRAACTLLCFYLLATQLKYQLLKYYTSLISSFISEIPPPSSMDPPFAPYCFLFLLIFW